MSSPNPSGVGKKSIPILLPDWMGGQLPFHYSPLLNLKRVKNLM